MFTFYLTMKLIQLRIAALIIFTTTAAFQCDNCRKGDLRLDKSRTWLPLKGMNQLTFTDDNGVSKTFDLKIIDTIENVTDNECMVNYRVEYIQATLYLNSSKTDSIYFQLAPPSHLHIRAYSNNSPNITSGRILQQSEAGRIEKFDDYRLRNRPFSDVILLIHNVGYADTIDSVFLANRTGIIGFSYYGNRYALQ